MSKKGWHQSAVDRAKERIATLKADQLATHAIVASVTDTIPATETPSVTPKG